MSIRSALSRSQRPLTIHAGRDNEKRDVHSRRIRLGGGMTHAMVMGAGPAGLAAAHELTHHGASVTVVEKMQTVGGLARTIPHNGCLYDIGPHRFYTKNMEVLELFVRIVGKDDLIRVPRLTRIYYQGKFFNYPLTPFNALLGLGIASSTAIFLSYVWAGIRRKVRPRLPRTFEEWVVDKFGNRLYRTFFQTYTEKVWGIPCSHIGADWAEQRIQNLTLAVAIRNALLKSKRTKIKTLVDEFLFPRLGSGLFYDKLAAGIASRELDCCYKPRLFAYAMRGKEFGVLSCKNPMGHFMSMKQTTFCRASPSQNW